MFDNQRQIKFYVTKARESPFEKRLSNLNKLTRVVVLKYIDRVARGGSKQNIKALQEGVFEIKINYGPGYRVYFAEEGKYIILLLIGGNKRSQRSDIIKAKKYWSHYGKKK